jgi:Ca2+/H+ antiporter
MGGLRWGGTGLGLGRSTGAAVISCPSICPVTRTFTYELFMQRTQFMSLYVFMIKISNILYAITLYITMRTQQNKGSNSFFQTVLANQDWHVTENRLLFIFSIFTQKERKKKEKLQK